MRYHRAVMDALDLVGVRYSSSKPPNPTWIAWGSERGGALVVDGLDHVSATFADRLAKGPPRVLAVDVPLGVPTALARDLVGVATNGMQVLERLVGGAPAQLDEAWARFAVQHPGALRLTDAITHGAPSITAARPPSWRALRSLAKALWPLRDRVVLVPFEGIEMSPMRPMVFEVSPGALLRVTGLPYLARHTDATASDATAERLTVLQRLADAVATLGARVELPAHVAHACANDAGGDALDAVLSLVCAHLATRGVWTPPPLSGHGAARAAVEGWIVRPG
jgi:hypothetical protein